MGEGGFAFLRKSHGGCNSPPDCCQEPPFESIKKQKDKLSLVFLLVGEGGFEPPKASPADLQSVPFGHSGIPPYSITGANEVELVDGLEPPTC